MASLEEEVVSQVMNQGENRKYLLDAIKVLKELGLKVDDKAIETSVKRYELLKAYNSQDNSKKTIKKTRNERVKKLCAEIIEEVRKNYPSIISAEIKIGEKYTTCLKCEQKEFTSLKLKYIYLVKLDRLIKKEGTNTEPYCLACGNSPGSPGNKLNFNNLKTD